MMLRTQSPEVYDKWVSNEIRSPIRASSARSRNSAGSPATTFVAGGAGAVATTDFRDSPKGLFSSPPQCYMHRQASFIPAFFPKAPRSVSTRTSSTCRPMPTRISASRFSVPVWAIASDLMPGGVGAGSFWTGMVDYTGGKPTEEVASEIQKSWDALK
jgi:hypothetical protein